MKITEQQILEVLDIISNYNDEQFDQIYTKIKDRQPHLFEYIQQETATFADESGQEDIWFMTAIVWLCCKEFGEKTLKITSEQIATNETALVDLYKQCEILPEQEANDVIEESYDFQKDMFEFALDIINGDDDEPSNFDEDGQNRAFFVMYIVIQSISQNTTFGSFKD